MSIPGRFGLSAVSDYVNRRYVMVVSLFLMAIAIVFMARAASVTQVMPFPSRWRWRWRCCCCLCARRERSGAHPRTLNISLRKCGIVNIHTKMNDEMKHTLVNGITMTAEERLARLETAYEYEQEWRREILERIARLESKQRWMIGLLALILIAVIGSNLLG